MKKPDCLPLGVHAFAMFAFAVLVPTALPAQSTPLTVEPSSIRRIVAQALPFVQKGGAKWIKDQDCLSCHRTSFQVWALNRAVESGFEPDLEQLSQWNTWATDWRNIVNPKRREGAEMKVALMGESDTVAQLLLGKPLIKKVTKVGDAENTEIEETWVTTYRQHLLQAQQLDGSWDPAGQLPLQKRSKRETREVTTMWALLGLKESRIDRQDLEPATNKAKKWLGSETNGESTEWWAVKLLLERADANAAGAAELRESLVSLQHEDGGWGWLAKDESDALATGMALFALARHRVKPDHTAVQKAISFLKTTQQQDGSWRVKGTKTSSQNKITETASYWGTCWAVIGLLEINQN